MIATASRSHYYYFKFKYDTLFRLHRPYLKIILDSRSKYYKDSEKMYIDLLTECFQAFLYSFKSGFCNAKDGQKGSEADLNIFSMVISILSYQ